MGKGKLRKKGEVGKAATYISRTRAMRKLQLTLKDFRRLCILKGIHPHEPVTKMKLNKHQTKTWYYLKDIQFLAHEPLIRKFRENKIHMRKISKAKGRKDSGQFKRLISERPEYRIDHIVKERYPTLIDAVRDMDDALALTLLFSRLPRSTRVRAEFTTACRQASLEFMAFVISRHALRNVFISIKGIYYRAEVCGQEVTFVVPHERSMPQVSEVDFGLMSNFVEFYITMMRFVNFKLYRDAGLHYPPRMVVADGESDEIDRLATLNSKLIGEAIEEVETVEVDEFEAGSEEYERERIKQKRIERLKHLFGGMKFFLSREVPREALTFMIRSCGGSVSWDAGDFPGALFPISEATHVVTDRPKVQAILGKWYIQPQWIADCINARDHLPMQHYFPGAAMPPHLSPFVDEGDDELAYVPGERLEELKEKGEADELIERHEKQELAAIDLMPKKKKKEAAEQAEEVVEMEVVPGTEVKTSKQMEINKIGEDRKLREMMIPKKLKFKYKAIVKDEKRRKRESRLLHTKRLQGSV